ncbi:MAG TPA: S8 family peptidase [Pyrinomonadaceae bacterium]|nr:S8 family peptidase [Pyrinomonadaceae bacterium]
MKKIVFVLLAFAVGIFALSYAPVQSTAEADKIKKAKNPIPNRYIVVLEEWATGEPGANSNAEAVALELGIVYGGRIDKIFKHALNGFSVELNANQAERLSQDPRVEFVEEDGEVFANTTQTGATWGLDRIDQRDRPTDGNYNYTPTGSGVNAYIIDTGIRRTHAQFGGRAFVGYDAIGDGQNSNDCNGHGTHVAGTVGGSTYGVAKAVRLYAVRVLNCTGSGSNSGVIAGVDWVKNNHVKPAVANMSLGGGASSALDTAVNNAIAAGVTFAVAAGNDNLDACNYSPARAVNAITVGSTTSTDARSSFSNYGTCLDIFAPGSSITSAWYTSDTATNTISGTSMASPHVAGVAALYLQNNTAASPSTVRNEIVNTASSGKLTSINTGSPNLLLYSLLSGGGSPPPPPPPTCSGETYTGTLSGAGANAYQPNGSYYYSSISGTHSGNLTGPSSADFDLYLQKWNGSSWVSVKSSLGSTSTESVTYSGTAGYYRWRIYSYSGSGSYSLCTTRP